MKLKLATPTESYSMLRLESAEGQWEMGIYPTLYGTRVACGRIGSQLYLKGGYCCGTDSLLLMEVTVAIASILSTYPESATTHEVESYLPQWNLRPINLDDGLANLRRAMLGRSHLITQIDDPDQTFLNRLTEVCTHLQEERYKLVESKLQQILYSP
jgi:hypothetical protein